MTGNRAAADLVRRDVRALQQLQCGFAAYGLATAASLRHLEGDRLGAIAGLERALATFHPEDRGAYFARLRLAQVRGSDVQEAEQAIRRQGIKRPDRVVAYVFGGR